MLVLIRGAGDLATGIALRLYRAGMQVVMTDLPEPTAIRRTVCFSQAVVRGETAVEGITARKAAVEQVPQLLAQGIIPVLADPDCVCKEMLRFSVRSPLRPRRFSVRITTRTQLQGIILRFCAASSSV